MRSISVLTCVVLLTFTTDGRGQSFEFFASGGPTITDTGGSVAAGLGAPLSSRLTLLAGVEWIDLVSRLRRDDGSTSYFRGGTLLLGTAQLRVAPLGRDRVGPFVSGGFAAGVSRPHVNEIFPTPVSHVARGVSGGGGLLVPLGARIRIVAEARMLFGVEGTEGILAIAPVHAGLIWRF